MEIKNKENARKLTSTRGSQQHTPVPFLPKRFRNPRSSPGRTMWSSASFVTAIASPFSKVTVMATDHSGGANR